MSVTFLVTGAPTFPLGVTLGAYRKREWTGQPPVTGDPPRGPSSATSSAVDTHGFATFTGLDGSTPYYAGAEVGGVWHWLTFRTEADAAGGSSVSLAEVEALVAAAKAELVASLAAYALVVEANAAKTVTGNVTLPEASTAQLHILTMKASATITLPKPVKGTSITVYTIQDAPGSRAITWHSPSGSLRWPGGSVPTNTQLGNAIDVWNFVCGDNANWDGAVPMLDMK